MKKIMFNDKYGLTEAVLKGRKTMTRRNAAALNQNEIKDISKWGIDDKGRAMLTITFNSGLTKDVYPQYQPGEIVAVAQSYRDAGYDPHLLRLLYIKEPTITPIMYHKGWKNKMYVSPTMMPHQICITNVRFERLQDISEEDCIREGVFLGQFHTWSYVHRKRCPFNTPREAFAELIDRISKRGTWESNPYVFVYEFELVR